MNQRTDQDRLNNAIRNAQCRARKVITANKWTYFVTLTFADATIRENYQQCVKQMKEINKLMKNLGYSFFYTIGLNKDKQGYHVHGLILQSMKGLRPLSGEVQKNIVHIKTAGRCFEFPVLDCYGVGWQIFQEITPAEQNLDDYMRIACYILMHFAPMKIHLLEKLHMTYCHLYYPPRNVARSKSRSYCMQGGFRARLYNNAYNSAAVVTKCNHSLFAEVLKQSGKVEVYKKFEIWHMRVVGEYQVLKTLIEVFAEPYELLRQQKS